MSVTQKIAKSGVLALGLAILSLAAIMGWEALNIGLLASEAEVDAYHFGSDAMVGEGGWRYESKSAYVTSAAIEASLLLLSATLLVWSAWNHSKKTVVTALGVSAATILLLILPL